MITFANCPNCGAPIHDYICDYCGTVFPTNLNNFNGRNAMLIAVDDDKNLFLQNLSIHSIEENRLYEDIFYTSNMSLRFQTSNEITIIGSIYDDKAIMHHLKELKDIFNKRLKL